jgi:hypothetical protein
MLAKTTISGEEHMVLRRAVLADLPTIEAVLAAYQDVNQRHARALHERFQRELLLLNTLGSRAGVPGRSHAYARRLLLPRDRSQDSKPPSKPARLSQLHFDLLASEKLLTDVTTL